MIQQLRIEDAISFKELGAIEGENIVESVDLNLITAIDSTDDGDDEEEEISADRMTTFTIAQAEEAMRVAKLFFQQQEIPTEGMIAKIDDCLDFATSKCKPRLVQPEITDYLARK